MYGNPALPLTGTAGLMILGHSVGIDKIVLIAVAVILTGVFLYRYGSRAVRKNRAAA